MPFEKRPDRGELFDSNPIKRLEYDSTKIVKGMEVLRGLKIKGAVIFGTHTKRDLNMYGFDKDDIADVQKA